MDGNYYMIPQDYQGGPNPVALKTRAIGQDRLQEWIANRIKAKKAVILLDTWESGALTSGPSGFVCSAGYRWQLACRRRVPGKR